MTKAVRYLKIAKLWPWRIMNTMKWIMVIGFVIGAAVSVWMQELGINIMISTAILGFFNAAFMHGYKEAVRDKMEQARKDGQVVFRVRR